MKTVGRIAFWLAAIAMISAILVSLDYTWAQAILISLIFCPCALALKFLMPKARKPIDKVYLSLAVMASVILLILVLAFTVFCFAPVILVFISAFTDEMYINQSQNRI